MKEATGARRATTSYTVGKSSMHKGDIFREYLLPGGGRAKVLDEDIFNEALRRGSRALEKINAKRYQNSNFLAPTNQIKKR